jgi:hypothetical protein
MDYATKELTDSLQKIVALEAQREKVQNQPESEQRAYCAGSLSLSTGVDSFLEARKEFQEKTRCISLGCY